MRGRKGYLRKAIQDPNSRKVLLVRILCEIEEVEPSDELSVATAD
jgi:hypothetical protein